MESLIDRYAEIDTGALLSPRDLSSVSSVSSDLRQLWRSRKIAVFDRRAVGDASSRHRASWKQACQYAVLKAFGEQGADLALVAQALTGDKFSGDFFLFDRTEGSDLYLVFIASPEPQILGHGSSAGFLTVPIPSDAGSLAWINWSALQRHLVERYEAIRPEILKDLEVSE